MAGVERGGRAGMKAGEEFVGGFPTAGVFLGQAGYDFIKGEEGKKILQQAGIPGIKYFDQMSRGEQTGTRNFVVFDPNHLTILERNAKPIK